MCIRDRESPSASTRLQFLQKTTVSSLPDSSTECYRIRTRRNNHFLIPADEKHTARSRRNKAIQEKPVSNDLLK